MGLEVPQFYILPDNKFDFKDGISLSEMEFPIYYNFFLKKRKTALICSEKVKDQILTIFRETLLGPEDLSDFKQDFARNYKGIPFIKKELKYFAKNPFNLDQKLSTDLFIDFFIFDKKKELTIFSEENKENRKI